MNIMDLLTNLIMDNSYVSVITAVIALFSAISAVTPTPKEGSVLSYLYKIIDILALNIGKAKDK